MLKTVPLSIYLLAFSQIFLSISSVKSQVNFTTGKLTGTSVFHPTSLQFGPDGKLYVSTQDGTIYRYTVTKTGSSYAVSSTEVINLVKQIPNHNDDGTLNNGVVGRQVTGILVAGTPVNPKIYVSSSDPRIGGSGTEGSSPNGDGDLGLDTNSGILSLLQWNGSGWTKTDLVRGLPRSEENHAQNGMALNESTNQLYLASGGMTNAGSPSVNFAMITEYSLAACLLKIDLNAINSMPVNGTGNGQWIYDIPTLDDPTRSNSGTNDMGDPFGGNDGRNQAKIISGGPVQVFSPGFRNLYDVVITKTVGREGRIYGIDNGANQGWGGYPDQEGTPNVTNNYVAGEPGSLGPGVNDAQVNNLDNFHLIYKPGMSPIYGGHPVPIRANPGGAGLFWKDGAGNQFVQNPTPDWPPVPLSMANPVEGDYRNAGVNDGALTTFTSSTNGMVEYTATSFFGGQMTGDMLAVSFDGAIYRVKLNTDGNAVASKSIIASGFGTTPLDITAQGDNQVFPGTIWVADYVANVIHFFEPVVPNNSEKWNIIPSANGVNPDQRHENAFVEAGGKFYLLGGRGVKPVNVYDPATNLWTTAAPIPGNKELHHFQAVTVNNKIYIINAFTGAYPSETPVPDIYVYDIATNTWTVLTGAIPSGRARGSAATAVYNNKIYIAGGITNGHNSGAVNWTDSYDPSTGAWTVLSNAPHNRDHVQGTIVNGKLYLAGGRRTNASAGIIFTDVEPTIDVFDIATNSWTTLPQSSNIPVSRAGAASVPYKGKIVIVGGESSQSMAHNQVHALDPVTNTWSALPTLVTGRHGTGAIQYRDTLYIAAGSSTQGGSTGSELNTLEKYPSVSAGCSGNVSSTVLDDDEDGYSNKDEFDNQTDPCSAASKPKDNDGDFLSNLRDTDDDNDGIADITDVFHIDAQNGKNKTAPFTYPFLNGNPGTGLFGMGFTGLMSNGTDPDQLYDPNANGLIMGGASGLATIPASTGSPLNNAQLQAFQFGLFLNSSSPKTIIEAGLISPYFNAASVSTLKDELHGIYMGTGDQDNYVLIAITPNFGNPAITVIIESGGAATTTVYPVTGLLSGNVTLYLEVDPANGTVQPKYKRLSDSAPVNVGSNITLTGALLTKLQGPDAVAIGLLASSRSGKTFSATWDYVEAAIASTPPPTDPNAKRVNSGGPTVTLNGTTWTGDTYYTDISSGTPSKNYSTTSSISNTTIPTIYQTERYGKGFVYNIPVTNGNYEVKLHFAELYWNAANQRTFNVDVENGQGNLSNFDVYAEAGKLSALIKSFNITVTDGTASISFTAIKDHAKINGIEIIPVTTTGSKPTANAGADKSITLPTNSVTLDGSGTDSDGTITGYLWSQLSGPNTAQFSSNTIAVPTVSNLVAGTYVFSLVTKDNQNNNSDPDQVTITVVNSTGSIPTANAGGDKTVTLPQNSVMLDGSGTDSDGTISGYQWSQVSGPNTAQFSSTTIATPTVSGLVAGNYVFSLVTKDNQNNNSNPDQVNVTVNSAPVSGSGYRINAGGPALTINGISWSADQYYANVNSADPSRTSFYNNTIANTTSQEIYRTERYGKAFNYNIPVTNGTHVVKLHFAEIYWNNPGQRVMNVNIENGQASLNNFDILASVAKNTALIKEYTVNVTDGTLNIQFTAVTDNAKISAIEVIPQDAPPPPPPPTNTVVARINSGGPQLNVNGETWSKDVNYSADPSATYKNTSAIISNTTNQELYRTERYGKNFSYIIPVAAGTYEVRLHFAELYWTQAGARVFNVNVENGQGLLTNFDIFSAVGKNSALVKTFTINCTDGNINIALSAIADNAKISGIEILQMNNTTAPSQTSAKLLDSTPQGLTIKAAPNPTVNDFSISFESNSLDPVQLKVVNANGMVVEIIQNIDSREIIKLGQQYTRGSYYLQASQGSNRAVITLIKQ